MSVENLKEYAVRCANEPELRAKAKELGAMDLKGHMLHADSLGLDWSERDIIAFKTEVLGPDQDLSDLTEEDLEGIAGGAVTLTAAVTTLVAIAAAGATAGVVASATAGAVTATGKGGW